MKIAEIPKWGPIVLGGCAAIAFLWNLPSEVSAMKAEVKEIRELNIRQEKLYDALESAYKKSPPGWRWERTLDKYVSWPDDPRLKNDGE